MCCRSKKIQQGQLDKNFDDSVTQLAQAFDIRNLLKTIRRIEVLFTVLLNKRQQKLMGLFDSQIMIKDNKIDENSIKTAT